MFDTNSYNTLFLLHYLIFMPVVICMFAILLRYLRKMGFIDKGTSHELVTQCISILDNVNVALSSASTSSSNNSVTSTNVVAAVDAPAPDIKIV